jgi:hypothetical protein
MIIIVVVRLYVIFRVNIMVIILGVHSYCNIA